MPKLNSTSNNKNISETFVCEIPLRVTQASANVLNARFEAARQMYNALLGEGIRRLKLMRQSKAFNQARAIPPTDALRHSERAALFKQARDNSEFSEYALSRYATRVRRSWLGEHLDAHTVQILTKRAFSAVSRVTYGKGKKVRFKGKRGLHSVEGKSQGSAIKWKDDHVAWSGISLPMVKDALKDPVIAYGLAHRVKYRFKKTSTQTLSSSTSARCCYFIFSIISAAVNRRTIVRRGYPIMDKVHSSVVISLES